jgi:DNA-binding beta-propeller fold protein YncE
MTSKRRIPVLVIASLLLPALTMADDVPTAVPVPVFELEGLSLPSDVAVGTGGQIYVVDGGNHQVAVFDASGQRVTSLGMLGSDEGQFLDPLGIDTGPGGEVYVADKGNKRLVVFDAEGDYRRNLTLSADGEDVVPVDVAVDPRGRTVFVTDNAAHRVAVFDVRGKFLRAFGEEGDGDGQFRFPATIDIDAAGNAYVVDVLNARVQKFSPDGEHLLTIGKLGGKAGTFYRPKGVAVSDDGRVFVGDSFVGVVHVFDAAGQFLYMLGDSGTATVFETPVGLAAPGQRLFVTQMLAGKVAVFERLVAPAAATEDGE